MKQVNNQPVVYIKANRKPRYTNITSADVAEIAYKIHKSIQILLSISLVDNKDLTTADVALIAYKIQQARDILDTLSLTQLGNKAGTSRQNLQQLINRRKAEKGGSK